MDTVARAPLVKGEQVRVEGYEGVWVVVQAEHGHPTSDKTFVEVHANPGGTLLVVARKCHRGHLEWVDDD